MSFKFNPALLSETVRQVVLALVLFGVLQVTDVQLAGGLAALSAVLALFTITNSTPNSTLEAAGTSKTQVVEAAKQNAAAGTPGGTGTPGAPGGAGGENAPRGLGNFSDKGTRGLMLFLALVIGSSACATNPSPKGSPERQVALYGIQAGKYLAEVKTSADELYTKKVLPEEAYKKVLTALIAVNTQGERLGVALKAYDAAINDAERNNVVAQIDAALLSLQALLPTVIPEGLPADVAARIARGIGEVNRLLLTIARFTAPQGTFMRQNVPLFAN
jgi:hypothetical protein